jgi:protein-disulfide isomerase
VLGVVGAALLAAMISIAVGQGGSDRTRIEGGEEMQQLIGGIPQDGAFLGPADAAVTITVFTDLQAPSGADYEQEVVDPLIEEYARTDDARLELRHFSFTSAETNSAAYAAVAAGEQDREWQYADLFFRNQDEAPGGTVTDQFLRDIANAVPELDADTWAGDLESTAVGETVQADAQLALDRRLPAAPAVVVTGPTDTKQLDDTPSLDEVRAAVAALE